MTLAHVATGQPHVAAHNDERDVINALVDQHDAEQGAMTYNSDRSRRAFSLTFNTQDIADLGGAFWTFYADPDNSIVGDDTFAIYGYPRKSTDGTTTAFQQFVKFYFQDGKTSSPIPHIDFSVPVDINFGGLAIHADDASSGTTHTESYPLVFTTAYWSGSASVSENGYIQSHRTTAVANAYQLLYRSGTEGHVFQLASSGAANQCSASAFTVISDMRTKDQITEPERSSLKIIADAPAKAYFYKSEHVADNEFKRIGPMANDFPEDMVRKDSSGLMSLDIMMLTGTLWHAVAELDAKVNALSKVG